MNTRLLRKFRMEATAKVVAEIYMSQYACDHNVCKWVEIKWKPFAWLPLYRHLFRTRVNLEVNEVLKEVIDKNLEEGRCQYIEYKVSKVKEGLFWKDKRVLNRQRLLEKYDIKATIIGEQ